MSETTEPSDIVERLRASDSHIPWPLVVETIAEIERLRNRNAELLAALIRAESTMRNAGDRLRTALEGLLGGANEANRVSDPRMPND